jgi:hypothetical protein
VGVRQDDRIDVSSRHRGVLPVAFTPFFLPLKHATVNQDLKAAFARAIVGSVDQVLGSGHRSGGAQELNVWQGTSGM